jgi:REP element-mobilizing transposase RayT
MQRRRSTIASHLVLTEYGHWIANDPRGSGSTALRDPRFEPLGPIHHGRKREQPHRDELRAFYQRAEKVLTHETIWFNERLRNEVAAAFGDAIRDHGYTCWACAVCANHAHLLIRIHRDDAVTMWRALADSALQRLRDEKLIPPDHPLWSQRPYKRFVYTPAEVRKQIAYIEGNPPKERLAPQTWAFVKPYNGWPFHKTWGAQA